MIRWATGLSLLLWALILGACAMTPLADSRNEREVTITWRTENVEAACYQLVGENTYGCASWRGANCTVWSPAPTGQEDDMAKLILGHEVLHCFRGAWH